MTDKHNHFTLAFVVSKLGDIAHSQDAEKFSEAVRALDMAPVMILRGISFLGDCMENLDIEDLPPKQVSIARSTITEITALCAALLDQQNSGEILDNLEKVEAKP